MADIDKIHTDLPLTLNREFFDDLVENFTTIKRALTEQSARMDQIMKLYSELKEQQADETQLINDTGATTEDGPRTIDISDSDSHILQ